MTKKQRAALILNKLKEIYPEVKCALVAEEPWQLLIAVRLSAQCRDDRVNEVTPALFRAFPTLLKMAEAEVSEIEAHIRRLGLYHEKAKDIKGICHDLIHRFDGVVPSTIEELVTLPGVGRKTANLIVGDVYNKPAVVVDTHFIRLSNRMGLTESKNPEVIEREMRAILDPEESMGFCHRIVWFGREYCPARNQNCSLCPLKELCKTGKNL